MTASTIFPRERVTVVGVLNTTPDSFSDGGRLVGDRGAVDVDAAVAAAARMTEAGAQMLDVGGESTRPGALEIPLAIEIDRTAPVVEALAKRFPVEISIDTRKPAVAEAAIGAGARVVNDVSGLSFDAALADIVAAAGASLIVGHLRGTPETMQQNPHFDDVLGEVAAELGVSLAVARAAGIPDERLAVDPGIGFGKRLEDNLALLANAGGLGARLGLPVLVGPSRKAFLGTLTGDPVECRDAATAAACAVAIFAGADAVRVHDVAGAVRAAAVAGALRDARREAIA
ncbi:MAG: dihydropteroate synthase [Deltaproteobacteria bacterium]|nr:dihydropteroate synthase [Deltaproteobacteria bacterium]MBW2577573.1 dihydropteroate synthase [Deltaproteobacteria bacterium]